jgi:hypothetical protein
MTRAKKPDRPRTAQEWFRERVANDLIQLGTGELPEEEALWLVGFLVWGLSREDAVQAIAREPSAHKPLIKLASHEIVKPFATDLTTRVYAAMTSKRPVA